jgi:hypothetical protein
MSRMLRARVSAGTGAGYWQGPMAELRLSGSSLKPLLGKHSPPPMQSAGRRSDRQLSNCNLGDSYSQVDTNPGMCH